MMRNVWKTLAIALGMVTALTAGAGVKYDEFLEYIEVNASDGDIGMHGLIDGDAWLLLKLFDSEWDRGLKARATDDFEEQGLTEFFFESAEPPCWWEDGVDWEPDDVVTLEEFLDRFEAGRYRARGETLDGELIHGHTIVTHNVPAAPKDPQVAIEIDEDGDLDVDISWQPGDDLGRCQFPAGLIPDPKDVEVVLWEIAVEPADDEDLPVEFSKYTVQLPGSVENLEVDVPEAFLEAYLDAGVTEFKFEIGAREESGNQTFTEGEFEILLDDED